jgi:hypothetical protein
LILAEVDFAQGLLGGAFAGLAKIDDAFAVFKERGRERSAPQGDSLAGCGAEAGAGAAADDSWIASGAFRKPGIAATLPELIRFLIDRSGYIKVLEAEGRRRR